MAPFQAPYLYDSDRRDSQLPEKPFDPKAVTRASWEPQPKKPKRNGPLVSFNRHPDAHVVPTGRSYNFRPMSDTTKWWIKWTRYFQLVLRALQLVGAAGLLTLMILISNADPITSWVMRITPGVVILHCAYAIIHFARPARARAPASSAAYQLFAGFTDLAVLPLYAFGAISVVNHGTDWSTILSDKELAGILVQAEYYALFAAGALHVISFCISFWLGLMFRRIANMPPDMNPLESNLTSRVKHKRNKSSVASGYTTMSENTKRLSTPMESHRRSGAPYEGDLSRPPSVPFHARHNSRDSFASSKRDSRSDLPSRQYQISPANSPRNSAAGSHADLKRMSNPRLAQRGSYVEVPLHETGAPSPRPSSIVGSIVGSIAGGDGDPISASPTRIAKFTEAWYASESLINRTQQRQRAMSVVEKEANKPYEPLNQRYDEESSDYSDEENNAMRPDAGDYVSDLEDDENMHPNPLRSNPLPPTPPRHKQGANAPPRQKTPFRPRGHDDDNMGALSEINLNSRTVSGSGSQDIADAKPAAPPARMPSILNGWGRNKGLGNRNSSIQPETAFYSKPYGALKPATPPIIIGGGQQQRPRQVSSGNDYDLGGAYGQQNFARRNVSGKEAEEGFAGADNVRYSRYSVLNE
ncbi:Uu.00g018790.m01.CDS01 [Anthostomella pinea]|uniref:Uu.00g018790.m01.CDS01 n=1 Tax=Anthostomella pinea TaxID=933095 RepID=A0AAI8YQQ1_9PEZI|nr:Uu.00g018790.m01.CDS01 [Anthostomella pinea]